MKYNFDELIQRVGTDSSKWESGGHGRVFFDKDSLSFSIADMDFANCPAINQAIAERLDKRVLGYTAVLTPRYASAVCNWFARRFDFFVNSEQIHVVHGVMDGVRECLRRLSAVGEGVIIQQPVYSPFSYVCRAEKRQIVVNKLLKDENNFYTIDFESLEQQTADPNNKILLFCSPHNPVGRVWTTDELKKVADICRRNDVVLLSDEIHCDLVRKSAKHIPVAKLCPENDIVTLVSPSKSFNIAGLEIANVIFSSKELKSRVVSGHSEEIANPLSIEAVIAAYDKSEKWLDQANDYIDSNLKFLEKWLKQNLPQVKYTVQEGTYLAWLDVSKVTTNSTAFAKECGLHGWIIIEQGDVFGRGGEGFVRLNVACPKSMLEEGLKRMKRVADRVKVGDKVKDFSYKTPFGEVDSFAGKNKNHKKVIFLSRYFGCSLCRADMADINSKQKLFAEKNANVLVVIQSEVQTLLENDVKQGQFFFDIACDVDKKLYKQWSVLPSIKESMFMTSKDLAKIKMVASHFPHGKYEGEEFQLPAVLVLDEDNNCLFAHYARTLTDLPSVEEILSQV